jgi:HD-like signal output (HDOD) protein
MIGSTHAEVGAYLLELWGMPETVVDAVALHHSCPNDDDQISAQSAIHIAARSGHEDLCKTRFC